MQRRSFLLGALAAATIIHSGGISAQDSSEERRAPAFEYYTVIQSLDPVTGIILAGGVSYHLQAQTRIWIDDRSATRAELTADMIGLRIGLDAYEDQSRRVITMIHVLKGEGRGPGREREAQ